MKKQIVAAAVAASISAVAFADISITGSAQVNYTYTDKEGQTPDTNAFTQETALKFVGKSGDTQVVIGLGGAGFDAGSLDNTGGSTDGTNPTVNVEDIYMTTSVAGVSIKSGTWDSGDNPLRDSNRDSGKFQANTSLGSLNLQFNTKAGASAEEYKVSTDLGGVKLGFTQRAAGETVTASTSMGGVNVSYLGYQEDAANTDKALIEVSGKVGDLGLKFGKATADTGATIDGNSWMGDYEDASGAYVLTAGQDVTAFEVSTSIAGNSVAFRSASIDDAATGGSAHDVDWNKVIVTRPLASGATFELTYTDTDDKQSGNDTSALDLELRVNF